MKTERFKWNTKGQALPENIVKGDVYRFTVLTPRLIRMEYSPKGIFEDQASQMVFYRDFAKNSYTVSCENQVFILETEELLLKYHIGQEFSSKSLSVSLKSAPATEWRYGKNAPQLKGTTSTLDNANGAIPLDDGVCSRNGYTVIDDSNSMLLTNDGWFRKRQEGHVDLYFFGYGHNYLDCIADYYKLTGIPPLLPDYALGNWWSRYHKYTQQEYQDLICRFEAENIPFSIAVVDMDWHTKVPEEYKTGDKRFENGWTGYTWNKDFFPDYKEFLKFIKAHNLKTSLNLHPAQGIGCHEEMYEEMAKACGVDPESKKRIKFDCLNPKFMESYFDILHHPYEEDGVDFWWMDWQQGDDYWWVHDEDHPASDLEDMSPLWLLNHLHILDISRNGKRPMFFSRYCGLGSHRYPVGFSGDTIVTWESLKFQPYFTANASNAGYSWWSHDIGGHMRGYKDDELQVRWMQLGVLSPINRLHSCNNPFAGKEPWNLNALARPVAEKWLRFRHMLFPYLYTMNYRNHKKLQPMVQPMYYHYPEYDEAYAYRNQFWFGSELMVAPITEKSDSCIAMGGTKVWFPEGNWFDFFNGMLYQGDVTTKVHRSLEEYPVFAKAGAIVPTQNNANNNVLGNQKDMMVYVFPGADNEFTMYEDAGDGSEYQKGDYATTRFSMNWGKEAVFTIHSAKGETGLIPDSRNWTILLRGFASDLKVAVCADGEELGVTCSYDEKTATTTVVLPEIATDKDIVMKISADDILLTDNASAQNRIFDILLHAQVSYEVKTKIWKFVCGGRKDIYEACPEETYSELLSAMDELIKCKEITL